MRFTVLVSMLAFTGCIPISSDEQEDDTRSGFHNVTVAWNVRDVGGALKSACPPGYTTIYLNTYRSYGTLQPPPDTETKLPCTPQGTVTVKVATGGELKDTGPDSYGGYFDYTPQKDIVLGITEETLSSFAAMTPTYYVEALTSDLSLEFDIYPDGGTGVMAWQFKSALTSAPLASCASAGVDQVEAAIRSYYDDQAPYVVAGTWACDARNPYYYFEPNGNGFPLLDEQYELGVGATAGIAVGTYKVELRAKRAGAVVGTSEAQLTIEGQNDVNPIWPAEIPINDR